MAKTWKKFIPDADVSFLKRKNVSKFEYSYYKHRNFFSKVKIIEKVVNSLGNVFVPRLGRYVFLKKKFFAD